MRFSILLSLVLIISSACQAQSLNGAWESGFDENHITMIVTDRYFSAAVYNKKNNTYLGTCGGSWRIEKNQFIEVHEFNTMKPEWIGIEMKSEIILKGDKLFFKTNEGTEEFSRIDNGNPGQLAGAWLITGRMSDKGFRETYSRSEEDDEDSFRYTFSMDCLQQRNKRVFWYRRRNIHHRE